MSSCFSKTISLLFVYLFIFSLGAVSWGQSTEENKEIDALFVAQGNHLFVFRLKPGAIRTEPLYSVTEFYPVTTFVYNTYGYPIPETTYKPNYAKIGEKLFISQPDGSEKEFSNARYQIIPIINAQGYPFVDAHTRVQVAAENFGLKWQDRNALVSSLLENSEGKFGKIVELNL